MVFHDDPERMGGHWSRFYRAVQLAVEAFNKQGGPRQIECFYDCGGHTDGEGYQRLVRDLIARRLAGLMFAFSPWPLDGQPPVEFPGVPRVAFNAAENTLPSVGMNGKLLIERALDRFAQLGRRNVAFLVTPGAHGKMLEWFQAGIAARGMRSLPFWIYPVDPHATHWVRHAVHAILRSDPSLAPDALLVSDDHLAEPLADALESLDVRVPKDLEVISHWNFPNPYTRRQPIHLIGPDASELLTHWLDTIDLIRKGEKVTGREMLAPVFKEEWEQRQAKRANVTPAARE
jgi:DNA-binding LacI/PurR family transcriptional regulator